MLLRRDRDLKDSDVTDPHLFWSRRAVLATASGAAAALVAGIGKAGAAPIAQYRHGAVTLNEATTPFEAATTYNNFYEFGTDKSDPARNAPGHLVAKPWSVTVDGACARPGVVPLEDLIRPADLEERVYRMRCVEGWSMVIPWIGVPLGPVLARFQPTANARYVAFTTLMDPEHMPGERAPVLDWPYREGLRLDEAMHPLTLLAVGLYGQELPAQNGAPLRLVVPWKYGFKGIKSIARISFVPDQPPTAWNTEAPNEYGFYSNVNPAVDHPRWSQKTERRIGEFFRRPTLPFNGYADQVADLYRGMDLKAYF